MLLSLSEKTCVDDEKPSARDASNRSTEIAARDAATFDVEITLWCLQVTHSCVVEELNLFNISLSMLYRGNISS